MDPSFLPLCEYIALVAENLTAIQKRCALRGYVPITKKLTGHASERTRSDVNLLLSAYGR